MNCIQVNFPVLIFSSVMKAITTGEIRVNENRDFSVLCLTTAQESTITKEKKMY